MTPLFPGAGHVSSSRTASSARIATGNIDDTAIEGSRLNGISVARIFGDYRALFAARFGNIRLTPRPHGSGTLLLAPTRLSFGAHTPLPGKLETAS